LSDRDIEDDTTVRDTQETSHFDLFDIDLQSSSVVDVTQGSSGTQWSESSSLADFVAGQETSWSSATALCRLTPRVMTASMDGEGVVFGGGMFSLLSAGEGDGGVSASPQSIGTSAVESGTTHESSSIG
jgi:hypothetical protein